MDKNVGDKKILEISEFIAGVGDIDKVFIYGAPGIGKTKLAELIIKQWKEKRKSASVGHSISLEVKEFDEPAHIDSYELAHISKRGFRPNWWQNSIIFIDNIIDKTCTRYIKPYMIDRPKKVIMCSVVSPRAFSKVVGKKITENMIPLEVVDSDRVIIS